MGILDDYYGTSKGKKSKNDNQFQINFPTFEQSNNDTSEPVRQTFKADFTYLMTIQKGKCASKDCLKYNGKKQDVHSIRNLDHIISVKLWSLMKKKGNVNMRSNIQLLCPNCHARKTAEDTKKIALYKQKHNIAKKQSDNLYGLPRY